MELTDGLSNRMAYFVSKNTLEDMIVNMDAKFGSIWKSLEDDYYKKMQVEGKLGKIMNILKSDYTNLQSFLHFSGQTTEKLKSHENSIEGTIKNTLLDHTNTLEDMDQRIRSKTN